MHSMNQQGNFQNQRMTSGMQSNTQSNAYQPLGFVQSHYQGIPNQQSGGQQSAAPVISHTGYSAAPQQGFGMSSTHGYAQQNAGFGSSASAGPVISHVGYKVGQDFRPNQSHSFASQQSSQGSMNNSQPVISHLGYASGQNFHPNQYQQTNQFAQQQQQQQQQQQTNQFAQQQQSGFGAANQGFNQFASNMHAVTSHNPVYQASNATSQAGPIISKVGYSSGNQQMGYASNQQASQTQNFGMNQRF
ncbi:hypothetical protein ACFPYJ_24195 [Paenibacillus solisilvae]|uniref:Uncharacterized protein n=1 Tax=Paenibacillus solisilvae TaxID=2486751 RepID=A0ABW0W1X5_9BACL